MSHEGPFLITVIKNVYIRLTDGRLFKYNESVLLPMIEVDKNVQVLNQLGYVSSVPPLPITPFAQAEMDSEFDRDPLYPFLMGLIQSADEIQQTLNSIHAPVQDIVEARDIPGAERSDKMIILIEDSASGWRYDEQSFAVDDGLLVLLPNDVVPTDPGRWIRYTGLAGGGGGAVFSKQTFIPTIAQTVFTLATVPDPAGLAEVVVNGMTYEQGHDYTLVGATLTWLNVSGLLDTSDRLVVAYQLP
jgi:hypothetical protein